MTKIAFIGLGNMGLGMAANLAKAGHEVKALDISKEALAKAVEAGCHAAKNAKDAVNAADVVVTMLPAGRHVRLVYAGDDGVFSYAKKGALFIDCSTIDVATARDVIGQAESKGFAMIDAPVSGGVGGAAAARSPLCAAGRPKPLHALNPFWILWVKIFSMRGMQGTGRSRRFAIICCSAFI